MKKILTLSLTCLYITHACAVTQSFKVIKYLDVTNAIGAISIVRVGHAMPDDIVVTYELPEDPSNVKITLEKMHDGALRCLAKSFPNSNSHITMPPGVIFSPAVVGTSSSIFINGVLVTSQPVPEVDLALLVSPSAPLRAVRASTQNNPITLRGLVAGAIHVCGVSGDIRASLLEGNTFIRTTNGSITLDLHDRCKAISATTTRGDVRVRESRFLGSLSAQVMVGGYFLWWSSCRKSFLQNIGS